MSGNSTTEIQDSPDTYDNQFKEQEIEYEIEAFEAIIEEDFYAQSNEGCNDGIAEKDNGFPYSNINNYANDENMSSVKYKGANGQKCYQNFKNNIIISLLMKKDLQYDKYYGFQQKMFKLYAIALLFMSKQNREENEQKLLSDSYQNLQKISTKLVEPNKKDLLVDQINQKIKFLLSQSKQQQGNNSQNLKQQCKQILQLRKNFIKSLLNYLNLIFLLIEDTQSDKFLETFYSIKFVTLKDILSNKQDPNLNLIRKQNDELANLNLQKYMELQNKKSIEPQNKQILSSLSTAQ